MCQIPGWPLLMTTLNYHNSVLVGLLWLKQQCIYNNVLNVIHVTDQYLGDIIALWTTHTNESHMIQLDVKSVNSWKFCFALIEQMVPRGTNCFDYITRGKEESNSKSTTRMNVFTTFWMPTMCQASVEHPNWNWILSQNTELAVFCKV